VKATYAINDLGKKLLAENPAGFDVSVLEETEGWIQWGVRTRNRQEALNGSAILPNEETPNESIEASIDQIESNLAHELVTRLQEASPQFLEETILELLGRMGYGDGNDSLEHLGGPGDEGVDGVINQDKLGLQRIYIQAKRYKFGNNIGGPALQNFMGALKGKGASGGVFITTSAFTPAALEYVSRNMEPRIVLIDGVELGRLLIQHEVGVIALRTYKVLEIDENFFNE
jgi:restriction system protein